MKATFLTGPKQIRVAEVPEPQLNPAGSGKDAIVRVVAACVCGSDVWPYRTARAGMQPRPTGHEFVGVVEAVGPNVKNVKVGDFVITPFYVCCGECINCQRGWTNQCLHLGWYGAGVPGEGYAEGGQSAKVRVPLADGTLVVVPGADEHNEEQVKDLLTLSDVMATGYHAAISGGVGPGKSVAIVGDGAVGLCAVIASKILGAERIVMMSRHEKNQKLAVEFGATDIVPLRGQEAVDHLKEMFDGIGPDCVLECVGTREAMAQAIQSARGGGQVGFVGVPHEGGSLDLGLMFGTNVGVRGGMATVRDYIEPLLERVQAGEIHPGKVFDMVFSLDDAAEAYAAMDERRAIKSMIRP
ncbi:MAG: alcohol dehydrogenase catalytic domain-containing protein [Rothia sp. (in: high G+C Gram-positive bacteria)]|uniref:zinc-binding dehydrogenase n=1 Tax=Rothia sp. (in: high G+C Gram-positive bacteria) TaxID=1885016 RepID=UPI0026E05E97|nr:alcohol dehydrogenase catalytic domain-containing protein [Rothia sp. (in: high G+C Gram-positive bacteria)]MDO5749652.1 alcohol dehydrogenase catalytic domain-containing protein [Rothia sp. (in: high G+C Gram-positive bacteria)]